MIDAVLALHQRNLDYARRLTADLNDDQLCAQPTASLMNHAAWVLGHLALVADFYACLLGRPSELPPNWHSLFGMNSCPEPDRSRYPSKAELLAALEKAYANVEQAIQAQPPSFWDQPPADPRWQSRFPTNRHMLLAMLINHDATHLGQLSAWRRALGLPKV